MDSVLGTVHTKWDGSTQPEPDENIKIKINEFIITVYPHIHFIQPEFNSLVWSIFRVIEIQFILKYVYNLCDTYNVYLSFRFSPLSFYREPENSYGHLCDHIIIFNDDFSHFYGRVIDCNHEFLTLFYRHLSVFLLPVK